MNHELTVSLPHAADASGCRSGAPGAGGGESVEQRLQIHRQGRSRLADGRAGRRAGCHPGRDNGIGIAAEHLPRLFEMFAQVDTSLERSRDGLGIGLTLVKTLVEMHGGTVDVRQRRTWSWQRIHRSPADPVRHIRCRLSQPAVSEPAPVGGPSHPDRRRQRRRSGIAGDAVAVRRTRDAQGLRRR